MSASNIVKNLDFSPMLSPLPVIGDDAFDSAQDRTPLSSRKVSKLSAIIGDGSFEAILEERAKQRRGKEDKTIAELRVCMRKMDESLSQEIKRRIECTTSLETMCSEQISEMELRLNSVIDERVNTVKERLDLLENKVGALNTRLEEERSKIPLDIEQRGKELEDMIRSFQEDFNVEKADRLNREGRIMKQLTDHANLTRNEWNDERTSREESIAKLTSNLDKHDNSRSEADEDFEFLIKTELNNLKKDILRETEERKIEDDEIVDAMNRYADNVQGSLSVLSSVGH